MEASTLLYAKVVRMCGIRKNLAAFKDMPYIEHKTPQGHAPPLIVHFFYSIYNEASCFLPFIINCEEDSPCILMRAQLLNR